MTDRVVPVLYVPREVLDDMSQYGERLREALRGGLKRMAEGEIGGFVLPCDYDEQGRQRWELRLVAAGDLPADDASAPSANIDVEPELAFLLKAFA